MDLPLHPRARVLTHLPIGLVAIDKPAGVRSHPNGSAPDSRAVFSLPYNPELEAYDSPEGEGIHLLHRLDSPTSGLILFATRRDVAKAVRTAFADHTVAKTYYALVRGRPTRDKEIWRDRLTVKRHRGVLRAETGSGDPAETEVELVGTIQGPPLLSLLRLRPSTGRTHQLRVQCAARRLPIVGDATYGDFRFNRNYAKQQGEKRMFLHAASIDLQTRVNPILTFGGDSPAPEAFPLKW